MRRARAAGLVLLAAGAAVVLMGRGGVAEFLTLTWLLRVPLVTAAGLLLYPWMATRVWPGLLRGTLAIEGRGGVFAIGLTAPLVAWSAMLCARVMLLNAPLRFGLDLAGTPEQWLRSALGAQPLAALLIAAPLLVAVARLSEGGVSSRKARVAFLATGVAGALLVLAAVALTWRWTLGPGVDAARAPTTLLEHCGGPALAAPPRGRPGGSFWAGSLLDTRGGGPHASHLLALFFLIASLLVYAGLGRLTRPRSDRSARLPALVSVLLLLMLACYALSGLTFTLDLTRVPTVVVLAGGSWALYRIADHDHRFRVRPGPQLPVVIAPEAGSRPPRQLAFAASGGGIQAAVWAASVLQRLEERLGPDRLVASTALLSGTSGGSVGLLSYLDRLLARPRGVQKDAAEGAARSSLDAWAWGLAYLDLPRLFLPFIPGTSDRGSALEAAFRHQHPHAGPRGLIASGAEIERGVLPPFVFTATIAESGEPFLFSPLELLPDAGNRPIGLRTFAREFPGADLDLATAVRLSATFPWITPLARAARGRGGPARPAYHLGDGGWFDNSGTHALLFGLEERLRSGALVAEELLVVQIRLEEPEVERRRAYTGWGSAFLGPLLALQNVREASQVVHRETALRRLRERTRPGVRVVDLVLRPGPPVGRRESLPLSWKLTREQKRATAAALEVGANQRALERIATFCLGGEE